MSAFKNVSIMTGAVTETYTLRQTVDTLLEICNHSDLAEIILCTSDRTTAECHAVLDDIRRIKTDVPIVIMKQTRPGMACVNDTIDAAVGSHSLLIASDMALDLSIIPQMIENAKKEPDVIHSASRWMKGCKFYNYGLIKRFVNFCAQKFLSVLYMRNLTDFTIPVQIAPSELYKSIKFEETGFPFLLEMVLKPIRLGYKFKEYPTNCYPRTDGKSSNSAKQTFSYLRVAFHIRFMPKQDILLEEHK